MHKTRRTKQTLLKPVHFKGLATNLTSQGLRYSELIGTMEREAGCPVIGESIGDTENFIATLESSRPPSRIILNPRTPSASLLLARLNEAQRKAMSDESINIGSGLPSKYELKWKRSRQDTADFEGQRLVLVAFDRNETVGYLGFEAAITYDEDGSYAHLFFNLELVYVCPQQRGKGFGLDLSIACMDIGRDLLEATYRAVPPGYIVDASVYADYESKGGEALARHFHGSLEVGMEMLRDMGKRRSIRFGEVILDACY